MWFNFAKFGEEINISVVKYLCKVYQALDNSCQEYLSCEELRNLVSRLFGILQI